MTARFAPSRNFAVLFPWHQFAFWLFARSIARTCRPLFVGRASVAHVGRNAATDSFEVSVRTLTSGHAERQSVTYDIWVTKRTTAIYTARIYRVWFFAFKGLAFTRIDANALSITIESIPLIAYALLNVQVLFRIATVDGVAIGPWFLTGGFKVVTEIDKTCENFSRRAATGIDIDTFASFIENLAIGTFACRDTLVNTHWR